METSLRLVLLLIGFVIIIGVIWDFKKNRKKGQKNATRLEPASFSETVADLPTKEEIIMIHVVAKFGNFLGGELLDAFNEVHLYHGDMQIFYLYENTDGTGNIMFSVVSAVEPGYFEISKMKNFVTPGITLFFKLTRPNQSIAAFELMLRTAKKLAMLLNGQLIDENRQLLTMPVIERYRDRIRTSTRPSAALTRKAGDGI